MLQWKKQTSSAFDTRSFSINAGHLLCMVIPGSNPNTSFLLAPTTTLKGDLQPTLPRCQCSQISDQFHGHPIPSGNGGCMSGLQTVGPAILTYLFQGSLWDAITRDAQVWEPVINLMKEFHEGSLFGSFVGQHVGQLMPNVFYQPGLGHVLPDEVGDSRDICRDRSTETAQSAQRPHTKGQPSSPAYSSEAHCPYYTCPRYSNHSACSPLAWEFLGTMTMSYSSLYPQIQAHCRFSAHRWVDGWLWGWKPYLYSLNSGILQQKSWLNKP